MAICNGKQERAFVGAWAVHCLHKILDTDEPSFWATDSQIKAIAKDRFAVRLDDRSYYKLKPRFISQAGRPATKFALLREVMKGNRQPGEHAGRPSEYVFSGLGWLLLYDQNRPTEPDLPAEEPIEEIAKAERLQRSADPEGSLSCASPRTTAKDQSR